MLYLANDHAGYVRKEVIKKYLDQHNIQYVDLGTNSDQSVDFPIYAKKLVTEVLQDNKNQGILICGNGIGMSICANRYKGIRAGLCTTVEQTIQARQHNDINVLVLGGRMGTDADAIEMVESFFATPALDGKYARRRKMLDE